MDPLTAEEQAILDGMLEKAARPGYNAALDTTDEERRVAAKHLLICLHELGKLGARARIVIQPPQEE